MSSERKVKIIDEYASCDSDSDDNVPLSQLRLPKREPAAVKAEPGVKQEPQNGNSGSGRGAAAKRDADASDSDDNVPISALAKRLKTEPAATPRAATKKKKRVKIKFKQQECTEELYKSLKGRLVQELLCRWWYAVEWPPANHSRHLHGVQELDGFRGAYIRVRGDDMGSIVDTRPQSGKPSFLHFFAQPSATVQKLLIKAYEKQMEVLAEHEGADAPLLKELKSALASASKISPEKADKSVVKIMKKYKELADEIKEIQEKAMQEDNTGTDEDDGENGDDDDDEDDEMDATAEANGDENDDDEDEDDDDDAEQFDD
ncbi:hypothetical protein P43SY_007862 [Pythium insidiosum]|uniref:Uncharacterized protein n=1 Tax=Pythium insidiosum TaxID=114742 RepID=A0AAD5LJ29_PYTIN|nr:hypothetical protein P43SY_007862 [Pythium insidiosum]